MDGRAEKGIVEALPLPAVLIGPSERIHAANAAALALLGPGIEGRHFMTALRQPVLLDGIEACLRGEKRRETQYLTTDGDQDVTYTVHAANVPCAAGEGVLVTFDDVTHLQQIGQMRRDFVANVSHELRTPLTAILGFIETLRGPARSDSEAQSRFLGIMEREAERMNRLVGDLLSLSHVEAEARMRPTHPVEITSLLRSVLSGLAPLADEAGVHFAADFPDTELKVAADADQLRQVFTNLIENGIKYGGAGCEVSVTVHPYENHPRLRVPGLTVIVGDTGPGIDPVHLPRLTERFYRVDSHRSREMGGTGLGLAIVKHIVNRHRGRLRITSEPGEGSRFAVILPMLPTS